MEFVNIVKTRGDSDTCNPLDQIVRTRCLGMRVGRWFAAVFRGQKISNQPSWWEFTITTLEPHEIPLRKEATA